MNARATALRISVAAMFTALTVVVAYLPTIPGPELKFSGFPLLLASLLIGPRTGFAVGCLTDVINFSLHPTGWFFPGFTLTQGLTAMLPGLLTARIDPLTGRPLPAPGEPRPEARQGHSVAAYLRLLGIFALTKLLTSVLLVSLFTSRVTRGTPLAYELTKNGLTQAVHVPIYALLALGVLQGLAQTDLYERLLKARR
jgi:ECF transporter S component (folate family)